MQCLTPITLKNEKGLERFRVVPCGKCYVCLQKRRNDWIFRINQELKVSTSAFFITLTYDDLYIPIDENNNFTVSKKDVQLFMKRLRKKIQPYKVRYFVVSEYGGLTKRPHYHMILFNFPHKEFFVNDVVCTSWKNGFVSVAKVNPARIAYVTKYCMQFDSLPEYLKPNFMLCSRRPAIGSNYLSENVKKYHREKLDSSVSYNGFKFRMPRYYQDKIFDDDAKLLLKIKGHVYSKLSDSEYDKKYGEYDEKSLLIYRPLMKCQIIESFSRKLNKEILKDNL